MKPKATHMSAVLWSALILSLATTAFASGTNPPLPGTYKTLTSTVLPGRATESMPCDSCFGQVGNLVMAESWDGVTLGTNWKVSCPQIATTPTLLYDGVVSGTGQRIFQAAYTGGTLWLSGAGAWGSGDPTYSGSLTSFVVVAAYQYVGGTLVGIVSNINFSGSIDGYDDCFTLAISNAEFLGATSSAPPGSPSRALAVSGPFPAFQGPSDCNVSGTHGSYWDVHDITFSILGHCTTSTRSSSWGSLKNMYR
jgi:hypothetical protein